VADSAQTRPFPLESTPIQVPDEALADLRRRLELTRWPEDAGNQDWYYGVNRRWLQELVEYWRDGFDWRAAEAAINAYEHYRVEVEGVPVHFMRRPGVGPDPTPLILTHGWPWTFWHWAKVVDPLADPAAHGGDPADAFHVVVPSLPGYGWSDRPTATGWGVERIGAAWAELMARLGYARYGAQGGDWGAMVTAELGAHDPDHVAGIHLNMPVAAPPAGDAGELSEREQAAMADAAEHRRTGTGYSRQQSTRPQTLGYGLVDSPAGQCAWIVEKFWAWSDCGGDPETVFTKDQLLDNVMHYWLPGTGASSARLYWESFHRPSLPPVGVPAGCSIFPKEIARPPRRWVEGRFSDLRYWNEPDRGGHFAAFEQPALFVDEVRAFFRLVR
jgi:epoxide hydrolase